MSAVRERVEPGDGRLARTDWARVRDVLLSIAIALLLAAALLWALSHVTRIIVIVIAAALVAYIASPAVTFVARWMPRLLAAILVYVVFLAVIGILGTLLVRQFVPQLTELVQNFPSEVGRFQQWLAEKEQDLGHPGILSSQLSGLQSSVSGTSLAAGVGGVVGVVGKVTDVLTNIVLVLVISLYFVLDGSRFWAGTKALVPAKHSSKVAFIETQLNRVIGGYIRGQLTLALIIGFSVGVGMLLLGVHFAVVLGVMGFFFELIPMIGPVLIGVLCVLVAAFQGFPLVLWVLLFYVALQLVESNVLGPRISGEAVGLHPAASILALITGAELFGLGGAVLAVPLAGLLVVIASAIIRYLRGEPIDHAPRQRRTLARVPRLSPTRR